MPHSSLAKKDFPSQDVPSQEKVDPLEQAFASSNMPEEYRNFVRGLVALSPADRKSRIAEMAGVNADFAEPETQNSIRSVLDSYDQAVPRWESSVETPVSELPSPEGGLDLSTMKGAAQAAADRLANKRNLEASQGPGAVGGTGARGREKNPRVSLNYEGYRMGDRVMVKRSDGTVEYDWQFMHRRLDTGEIVLRKKTEEGKIIEKEISPSDFDETQKLPKLSAERQVDVRPVTKTEVVPSPIKEKEPVAPIAKQELVTVEQKEEKSGASQVVPAESDEAERSAVSTGEVETEESAQDDGNPKSPKFRPAFWSKDWVEAKEQWKNVFQDATIGYDAEAWAESSSGSGAEKLLQGVNDLMVGLAGSHIHSEVLKKYSVRIHTDGPTGVFGDAIRVSAKTLMERGSGDIAELIKDQIGNNGHEETETPEAGNKKEIVVSERKEKSEIHVGDFVVWETNGTLRFKTPLRVARIEQDPKSKRPFAFFDEFATGVPVSELVVSEPVVESERSKTKKVLRRSDINEKENRDFSVAAQQLLKENGFQEGDKIIFFAEREREGALEEDSDGSLKIRDTQGAPWGIMAILMDSNGYIRKPDVAMGQATDDSMEPEHVSQNPTPNSDADIEMNAEKVFEKSIEQAMIDLEAARNAYVQAYGEYAEKNHSRTGDVTTLNITGDLSALQAARAAYDVAWKAAAEAGQRDANVGLRERERGTDVIQARIREKLLKTFVVDEEKTLAGMRASREMPPQEERWYKQVWMAYSRLPQWQKIAISSAIGAGVALGGGAIAGTALTGAWAGGWALRRAGSLSVSSFMGATMVHGVTLWDKTFGKKKTKEYKMKELAGNAGDVSQNLENLASEYQRILEEAAHREEKQMYLKAAIAAIAGAATSIGFGAAFAHDVPPAAGGGVGHAAPSGAPHTGPVVSSPEHVAPADVKVDEGSSLWNTVKGQLKGKNPDFDHLTPEQQTYVVSSLSHDEIRNLSLQTPDHLPAGFKIDPSVFNDDHLKNVLEQARHLMAGQEQSIAANNAAILQEHQAYPHEQMTTGRVAQIMSEREHPAPLPQVETPSTDVVAPEHAVTAMPLAAHDIVPAVAAPENLTPAGFENSLQNWSLDSARGGQLLDRMPDLSHAAPTDVNHLLATAAQKVGDSHPVNINPADTVAVANRLKDYMVAYPAAHQAGFSNYDQWAGVKNVDVKKFLDQTNVAPRAGDIRSALEHNWHHRGVRVQESLNGKLHNVPLTERHLTLGMALRDAKASGNMTVGDYLANNPAMGGDVIARVKTQLDSILHATAQGSKATNSNDILNR